MEQGVQGAEIRGQKDKDGKTKFILILEKKFFFIQQN